MFRVAYTSAVNLCQIGKADWKIHLCSNRLEVIIAFKIFTVASWLIQLDFSQAEDTANITVLNSMETRSFSLRLMDLHPRVGVRRTFSDTSRKRLRNFRRHVMPHPAIPLKFKDEKTQIAFISYTFYIKFVHKILNNLRFSCHDIFSCTMAMYLSRQNL